MVETIVMALQQELPAVRNIVADESSAIAERMETDMQAKFDGNGDDSGIKTRRNGEEDER